MIQVGLVALAVLSVCSVALWTLGRRFARRYVMLHGAAPPTTWLFRATDDSELESSRRFALFILPIDVIALLVYVLRP